MTTYICTLYYPPRLLAHCCLRSQNADYHSGGHPDPSHSVLLPSEPIKRPSQHSDAIQATPTLFAFRRGKGSTGGVGSTDEFSLTYLVVSCILSAHVTMCTYGLGWQQYAVGGVWVSPTVVVGVLAPKTTVGEKPKRVI